MIELYYCAKCRDHHLFDEEGQVDKCKNYKAPVVDFTSVVKELAEQLTRKTNVKSLRVASSNNKRGNQ
jgi:hypothetical protein